MPIRPVVALMAVLCSGPVLAQSQSLDLNVNDEAVRLMYTGSLQDRAVGGLGMDLGFLNNVDRGSVANLGLHVSGDAGLRNLPTQVTVGGMLFWADHDDVSEDALALGLGLRFSTILGQYNRLGVGGHVYYSPRVLSFLDAERYTEWGVRVNYHIIRQAHIYVGYRGIRVKFEEAGSETVDSGLHMGLKLEF